MAEIITVKQAARLLGEARNTEPLHKTFVLQMIKAERLKATVNANFNYYEIEQSELERFIKEDFLVSKPRGRNARRDKHDKMKAAMSDGSL